MMRPQTSRQGKSERQVFFESRCLINFSDQGRFKNFLSILSIQISCLSNMSKVFVRGVFGKFGSFDSPKINSCRSSDDKSLIYSSQWDSVNLEWSCDKKQPRWKLSQTDHSFAFKASH